MKLSKVGSLVRFYQVGGCVRDRLLGKESKDIDFSVEAESYDAMCDEVRRRGCDIKVKHPEHFTIRAIHPELGGVDFVLCRKEGTYSDGRRPDSVEMGTLADDLARRDFTVNALAEDESGNIIDLFGGQKDLEARKLRCVGRTNQRMTEDALRMLRALRFSITKGFTLDSELESFMLWPENVLLLRKISVERIREEMLKCFEFDTLETLRRLDHFWRLREEIFSHNLKLVPTIFQKKG